MKGIVAILNKYYSTITAKKNGYYWKHTRKTKKIVLFDIGDLTECSSQLAAMTLIDFRYRRVDARFSAEFHT